VGALFRNTSSHLSREKKRFYKLIMSSSSSSINSNTDLGASLLSTHVLAPNAFYLDDRQDNVSRQLLLELGVLLSTLGDVSSTAEPPFEDSGSSSSGMRRLLPVVTDLETWTPPTTTSTSQTSQQAKASANTSAPHLSEAITYKPIGGACFLDIRDSADAWIRIILNSGEMAVINSSATKRRVLIPQLANLRSLNPQLASSISTTSTSSSMTSSSTELTYAMAGRLSPPFISSLDAATLTSLATSFMSPLEASNLSPSILQHHNASSFSSSRLFDSRPDVNSRSTSVVVPVSNKTLTPCFSVAAWPPEAVAKLVPRFKMPDDIEKLSEADLPHFLRPGIGGAFHGHVRNLVAHLCEGFYRLGWVSGTGGSISIKHGNRIFMAPSSVQKERMQPQDLFVLDSTGRELYSPMPLPGTPRLKLSQCAPLFHQAFTLRGAGACIHTHDMNAVMVTLLGGGHETEFRVTHQEMIKGIAGHGFVDECVVPIIENTPHECDLADSLAEAMKRYPKSNAVLVRRHGVYVWGNSWEAAKTQAECYHYLFDYVVKMRTLLGLDPAAVPTHVSSGIGATKAYGTGRENTGGHGSARANETSLTGQKRPLPEHVHTHQDKIDNCCGDGHVVKKSSTLALAAAAAAAAVSEGFHGNSGTSSMSLDPAHLSFLSSNQATSEANGSPMIPKPKDYSAVLLDIEGCTTEMKFVSDVLFPYARQHVREWLLKYNESAEAREDFSALLNIQSVNVEASLLSSDDLNDYISGDKSRALKAALKAEALVHALMDRTSKETALKQLQGHIWRSGYLCGEIRGHVFPDTPTALKQWTGTGKKVYIYSSGSREAQKLLFKYSVEGDLRPFLSGYFDTKVGVKIESQSYVDIALSLGVDDIGDILFCTDSLLEAIAAKKAGMKVVLTDRPGNNPLPTGHGFFLASSLRDVSSIV
jgi:methylthioribulose-1-phosphate dehydratase